MAKSEFDVLEVFLTRPNRLLTRTALTEAIGLAEEPETSRAVDIRVMRLRKKIEADPANPRFLRTVRGEGYIFALPEEAHEVWAKISPSRPDCSTLRQAHGSP